MFDLGPFELETMIIRSFWSLTFLEEGGRPRGPRETSLINESSLNR